MALRNKILDLSILGVLVILATALTVMFSVSKLASILLYFGLPCLYLTWKDPSIFRKSFAFAFIFSIPLSVFVDTLAVFDGGWYVSESVVPYRLFGAATFEVYLFGLLWVLFAVLFYEHFFDHHRKFDWFPRQYRKLIFLFIFIVTGVTVMFFIKPALLIIPYFYTWISVTFVLPPLVWFLAYNKKFLPRFILAGVFFFFVLLAYELAALHVGLWSFPGTHFIGWVSLFGYSFPMEEFVFWAMFATPSILAYYEYFADDRKL